MKIAALDIGSNSLHLVVVETDKEKPFLVLASGKEMVRLGRSTARDRILSQAAMDRAVTAIRKFRSTAETYGARAFIAVATSAVREAANRHEFIERVAAETGVHVDILSGIEEARLIALAVSYRKRGRRNQRMLVIDIGGGSTELAVTQNDEIAALASLKLGAVRMTQQMIASDPISEKQLRRLRSELRAILAPRAPEIRKAGYDLCFGTSGTINTIGSIALHRRIKTTRNILRGRSEVTVSIDEVRSINRDLAELPLDDRTKIAGLSRARAEIIIAGGQILEAAMETLEVNEFSVCDWALREGVIIANLVRTGATINTSAARLERDPSLRGALALAEHYQADLKHAHRTAYLAQQLFDELRPLHKLGSEHRRLLAAAAILHDIGYFVSHTGHHKHSAYLIQNSEWSGFTASELAIISNVARYHRSTTPKARHPYFASIPEEDQSVVRKLSALLRVADALDRDHEGRVRSLSCEINDSLITIKATGSADSETVLWRIEERADLFQDEFGRRIEVITSSD
ncbi:MAG: Ppx/GppA family phosphatase [Acidobacteria bacterium]|nr:Ppx/GppA family phosphatase [Acidobacteriota bacterium]